MLPTTRPTQRRLLPAVVGFVREHSVRVVLPNGDGAIAALIPQREQLAGLGCTLALAPDAALGCQRQGPTLEVARKLGIDQPKTMRIDNIDDLPSVLLEFDFPFVLKPTTSWTGQSSSRLVPVDVIDKAEALDAAHRFLAGGAGVLAQQWACGRREGVTLFITDGEVLASCPPCLAHRTSPPLAAPRSCGRAYRSRQISTSQPYG